MWRTDTWVQPSVLFDCGTAIERPTQETLPEHLGPLSQVPRGLMLDLGGSLSFYWFDDGGNYLATHLMIGWSWKSSEAWTPNIFWFIQSVNQSLEKSGSLVCVQQFLRHPADGRGRKQKLPGGEDDGDCDGTWTLSQQTDLSSWCGQIEFEQNIFSTLLLFLDVKPLLSDFFMIDVVIVSLIVEGRFLSAASHQRGGSSPSHIGVTMQHKRTLQRLHLRDLYKGHDDDVCVERVESMTLVSTSRMMMMSTLKLLMCHRDDHNSNMIYCNFH